MTEFLVATEILTRDSSTPVFMKAARMSEKFGIKAEKSFDRASRASRSFSKDTVRGLDRIQNKMADFRGVTGGILGADIIREGFRRAATEVGSFITEAGKVESAEVVFKRFVGGMREARRVVKELRDLAARTPFEFEGLANVSKLLFAMGAATRDDLIPTLRMLGDTAGGNQDRFNRLAFAFGEVASNTKASFQEIRQFTNAQVPILKQLIKQWNVAPAVARKMIKEGEATFPEVLKGFRAMTREGGMFFKGMEDASRTFEGRMSTLRDNIKLTKSTIGLQLLPILKEYITRAIQIAQAVAIWAENNKELIRVEFTKWLKTTEQIMKDLWPIAKGVFKAISSMLPAIRALSPILPVLAAGWLANKIALKGLAAIQIVKMIVDLTRAIKAATVAQWLFNVAAVANPYGVIITAIIIGLTAVTAAIVLMVKHWDAFINGIRSGVTAVMNFLTREFWGFFRIFVWPLVGGLRLIAFTALKVAQALGATTLEREMRGVLNQLDRLDIELKKSAGQLDHLIARGEEFRKVFQGELSFNIKPVTPSALIDETQRIETGALRSPVPVISRPAFGLGGGDDEDPIRRLREFDIGTSGPGPVEPVSTPGDLLRQLSIKLDISGAPEGSKVTADGDLAPIIDINLLGGN